MASIHDPVRDQAMRDWLDRKFLAPQRDPAAVPRRGEVVIGPDWDLHLTAPDTPLLKRTIVNFRQFCQQSLDLPLTGAGGGTVELTLDTDAPGGESFRLTVRPKEVRVAAAHELGLLRGAMRILRDCANRRAPFLTRGERVWTPAFAPRIANTVFCPAAQNLRDTDRQFSDDYLALMAYFDISGVHVYLNLWDFWRSTVLSELDAPEAARNLADLRGFCARAAEFGIGVYPVINAPVLPADHPVFASHPEVRGARTSLTELQAGDVLCTSSPLARAGFAEAIGNLFAPEATGQAPAGAIFIVGGESFLHCYTRPAPPFPGTTNCAVCNAAQPAALVAGLINGIAARSRRRSRAPRCSAGRTARSPGRARTGVNSN